MQNRSGWFLFIVGCFLLPSMAVSQQPALPEFQAPDNLNGQDVVEPEKVDYRLLLENRIAVEIGYIRRVVKLTDEQESQLSKLSVESLEKSLVNERKAAPGVVFQRSSEVPKDMDFLQFRRLERAFDKAGEAVLTEEQRATYRSEKEKRSEFSRRLGVDTAIAILNEKLDLSEDQRHLLSSKLDQWTDAAQAIADVHLISGRLPTIPSLYILQCLDERQRAVFLQLPRFDDPPTNRRFFPEAIRIEK
jgi:hypothetical protein